MCLIIDDKHHRQLSKHKKPKPLVADYDIICYKIMERGDTPGHFFSLIHTKHWILGETYNSTLKVNMSYGQFPNVDIAFHAYRTKDQSWTHSQNLAQVECIIPRGSLYYLGCSNDIASNKMRVVREDFKP